MSVIYTLGLCSLFECELLFLLGFVYSAVLSRNPISKVGESLVKMKSITKVCNYKLRASTTVPVLMIG